MPSNVIEANGKEQNQESKPFKITEIEWGPYDHWHPLKIGSHTPRQVWVYVSLLVCTNYMTRNSRYMIVHLQQDGRRRMDGVEMNRHSVP
jgi:hypothetical protein